MSDKKAIVKVHYYQVTLGNSADEEQDRAYFSDTKHELESIIKELEGKEVKDRTWSVGETMHNSVLLESVKKINDDFWSLNFIKVRDDAMPGKINTEGVFTEIPLEENEYIGEDMSVLYAPNKNLLGIQRNFFSVSYEKIAKYFSHMQEKYDFRFEPILGNQSIPDGAIIRSVEISCVDLKSDAVQKVVENSDIYGATRILLRLGIGTSKKSEGLIGGVVDYLKKFIGDSRYKKIQVGYKENESTPVSTIDFIDRKLEDKLAIPYSKKDILTHDKICAAMLPKFKEQYDKL